jgi:hypothetical protein
MTIAAVKISRACTNAFLKRSASVTSNGNSISIRASNALESFLMAQVATQTEAFGNLERERHPLRTNLAVTGVSLHAIAEIPR